MGVKDWFRTMQPVQLYIILILTILFFITELVVSHITHALTLLMNSYHMLCNIMALTGCIITIKYGKKTDKEDSDSKVSESIPSSLDLELATEITSACRDRKAKKSSPARANQERKLKNTFGWTRIDVVSMLICGVFLASLCFSIYIEALQTLVHISHQDEMHHPISVLCIGAAGLVLNGVCYLLIGGYTFHQGSFLYVTESGDVILNKVVVNESVAKGQRRLSRTKNIYSSSLPRQRQRQGCWEMLRDINGCFFVIICAITVILIDHRFAKFVDPLYSLVSATSIMILSYPYIKESCFILLQTIPDTININSLKTELTQHFPDIVSVHDLHIWQLTASKVISTVHIIFQNPKVYHKIMEDVKEFFLENGITQVTIQPEFFKKSVSLESIASNKLPPICLMACQEEDCKESHCCPVYKELNKFKSTSKEIIPKSENTTPTLKSVKILNNELPSLRGSESNFSINSSDYKNSSTSEVEKNTKLHNEINKSLNSIVSKSQSKIDDGNLESKSELQEKSDKVKNKENVDEETSQKRIIENNTDEEEVKEASNNSTKPRINNS